MNLQAFVLIVAAYLLGSIPSAYIMGRLVAGVDITQHGSGNVGGTNAFRVLGAGPAIVVALVDVGKGFLPTLLAIRLLGGQTWPTLCVALAAVLGHNYSLYLRLRGGKGIATTIGVCFALFPKVIIILLLIAITVVAITRYVSVGSMLLVTLLPIVLTLKQAALPEIQFGIIIAILGLWRHRSNLGRLLQGTENRLGSKAD